MVNLREYSDAFTEIVYNYHGNAITAEQAYQQLSGIALVLEIKEDRCSPSVRNKVQRERNIIKGAMEELRKGCADEVHA